MTVAELFREWHDRHVRVNLSPAYYEDSAIQFRLRIDPLIGHRRIDTVNKRIVREMVAQMQQVMRTKANGREYAGHRTINKTLTVLKSMFTYAVDIDQLATNPVHGTPSLPEQPTRQIDAWPLEVIRATADASEGLDAGPPDGRREAKAPWATERNQTLILLAAYTGMRQSELLGLLWDEIDDDWIHVTHKLCRTSFTRRETKSRRGRRRVPLIGPARQLMADWRAIGAHPEIVFPNHTADDFMRANNFEKTVWAPARKKVGTMELRRRTYDARKMTFHELRHTFVSLCLAAGRDLWEVAHWVGDDPDMVKQVYGHYIPDSLGDTARLDAMLSSSR